MTIESTTDVTGAPPVRSSAWLAAGDALALAVAALDSRIGCGCGGDFGTCNACDTATADAEKAAEAWSALRKAANDEALRRGEVK